MQEEGGREMVNWRQFTLSFVQASVYTPENSAFAAGRVVATILGKFGNRFDGAMQVLPIPPNLRLPLPPTSGLPVDVPHIVLRSNDGLSWQLTAGTWYGSIASAVVARILP